MSKDPQPVPGFPATPSTPMPVTKDNIMKALNLTAFSLMSGSGTGIPTDMIMAENIGGMYESIKIPMVKSLNSNGIEPQIPQDALEAASESVLRSAQFYLTNLAILYHLQSRENKDAIVLAPAIEALASLTALIRASSIDQEVVLYRKIYNSIKTREYVLSDDVEREEKIEELSLQVRAMFNALMKIHASPASYTPPDLELITTARYVLYQEELHVYPNTHLAAYIRLLGAYILCLQRIAPKYAAVLHREFMVEFKELADTDPVFRARCSKLLTPAEN